MATWTKEDIVIEDGTPVKATMPVIISASRSTDIPAFYADWFMERLAKGYVKWMNPFNGVPLYVGFANARLVVFWSKNPRPMLAYLDTLDRSGIDYYFQFTMNDYDAERIEPRVPPLKQRIETFKALSAHVGRDRVIWRFDPLILTDRLGVRELLEKVRRLGDTVAPYTSRLVFSFIDISAYGKVAGNLERGGISAREFQPGEMEEIAEGIGSLVKGWGISAGTCGEVANLDRYGVEHNRCIDDRLMVKCFHKNTELMRFIGARLVPGNPLFGEPDKWVLDSYKKDTGQRAACGCVMSKDIGEYNTCPHLCHYCYANTSNDTAIANFRQHQLCPHAATITGK